LTTQTPILSSTANPVQTNSLEISNVNGHQIDNNNNRVKVDSDMTLKSKNTNLLSTNENDTPRSLAVPPGASTELPPAIEPKSLQMPMDSNGDRNSRPERQPPVQHETNKTNDRVEADSEMEVQSKNTTLLPTNDNDAASSLERRSNPRGAFTEISPAVEPKPLQTPVDSATRAETKFNLRTAGDAQQVQRRLIELGYLPFLADGIWGPHSIQALRAFRMSAGLGGGDQWDRKTEDILFAATAPRATAPVSNPLQLPPG
jgi:hypothetical protein